MLDALTSVPAIAGVALATAALFIRDMLEGEKLRPAAGVQQDPPYAGVTDGQDVRVMRRVRYRSYGLVCASVLLVLVVLRFVTLAG